MRTFDIGFRAPSCDGAGRHGRARSVSIISRSIARKPETGSLLIFEADNTAIVHNMDPPDIFPYKAPQMRQGVRCVRGDARSPRPARPGARGVTRSRCARSPLHPDRARRSIRKNWDDIRAQGHRMLDDMIDYVANIRDRPVWRPIPDEVRARFRAELPRQPSRSRRGLSGVHRFHRSLCDRQCSSGLHGMGAWRRHRRRHAGGDAGGRTQRQSRRARSHSDRGRTPDRRMDARDVRLPERGERNFRHRHVDGESDGGAGGANGGARDSRSGSTASATKARC